MNLGIEFWIYDVKPAGSVFKILHIAMFRNRKRKWAIWVLFGVCMVWHVNAKVSHRLGDGFFLLATQ